jgi:glycosyltransferase involved in cell wall biosynthesis
MRILLVGRNAKIGGGSTFRLNIGGGMIARGHEISVAALGGPMVRRYRDAGIRFHWVPPWTFCAGLLANVIRRERIDLVHASNTTAGDLALLGSQRAGVPLIVSLHNTISKHEAEHPCLKEARRILVFDSGAAESAGRFGHLFDTGKIIRVPRPVLHRPQEGLSPIDVAYVARLSSRKGKVCLSLIEGFADFARANPGASLTILGDGSMKRDVERAAAKVSAETSSRITVHGQVLDPSALLRQTGIVVGAGYAALESVMQGRAVIGAGFKGYGLLTADNVINSVECNFGDTVGRWEMTPANFLEALTTLRAGWDAPETRQQYWHLDRILAPIHSIDAVAARLEAIYADVLGSAGG